MLYCRVCTKQNVHNFPPVITRFPSATYHLPSFSSNFETHFIRSPIPSGRKSIQTHQFNPFLEITHRCILTVYFNKSPNTKTDPIQLEFPIIITNYPSVTLETDRFPAGSGGDDAVHVDLDLPEYTPKYEEN